MKPDTLLINTSRGDVVDNAALLEYLKQCHLVKVVLDVWEGEPDIDPELLAQIDIGTPLLSVLEFANLRQGHA